MDRRLFLQGIMAISSTSLAAKLGAFESIVESDQVFDEIEAIKHQLQLVTHPDFDPSLEYGKYLPIEGKISPSDFRYVVSILSLNAASVLPPDRKSVV